MPLAPSSSVQETRLENLATTVEAAASQAEVGAVNPSEDSDDIDIGEHNTTIVLQSQVTWTSGNQRSKEDILRYLLGLVILAMLNGSG